MKLDKKGYQIAKITMPQLAAIVDAADTLSGMIGTGSDFDPMAKKIVKGIDNFLKANGIKRKFN